MLDTAQLMSIMFMNTLGLTIIVDALVETSYLFTRSDGRHRPLSARNEEKCKESLAFVTGSSLDITLASYNIAYDAHELRTTFFSHFKRRDLID